MQLSTQKNWIYLVFNICLLVLVQMNLDKLRSIELHPDALANNFCREHQILKDRIVDSSEGSAVK